MQKLKSSIFDLIVPTSANLPPDVRAAMAGAMKAEASSSRMGSAMDIIFANIDMAISEGFRPIGREIVLRSPISEDEEIIKRFGIRAVIGKGGMGSRTLSRLKESGAVYLHAIGGAAQYCARCIVETRDVLLTEFGLPDAMWPLEVKDFPATVTMDAHGDPLHADVEKASAVLLEIIKGSGVLMARLKFGGILNHFWAEYESR